MHLVAISTDRLLAVTFPLRHGRIMKNYGLKIMLATMWVVAFAFATVRQLFVERRVALTLAIVIILFSVSWFPLVDVFFFITGKSLVESYGPAYMWIRSLALSNSAMNFVIYSARIRDFRDAYISISRKMFGCWVENATTSSIVMVELLILCPVVKRSVAMINLL